MPAAMSSTSLKASPPCTYSTPSTSSDTPKTSASRSNEATVESIAFQTPSPFSRPPSLPPSLPIYQTQDVDIQMPKAPGPETSMFGWVLLFAHLDQFPRLKEEKRKGEREGGREGGEERRRELEVRGSHSRNSNSLWG